jgi:hypothetical protein
MTDFEQQLRAVLKRKHGEAEAGRSPDFGSVWAGAEDGVARQRRRTRAVGGMAAAVALVAVVVVGQLRPIEQDWQFIDPNDIAGSTSWTAPSDVLLPTHQFDIYRDIPVLIESTGEDGGTLL